MGIALNFSNDISLRKKKIYSRDHKLINLVDIYYFSPFILVFYIINIKKLRYIFKYKLVFLLVKFIKYINKIFNLILKKLIYIKKYNFFLKI